jgi:hypothetical protein
MKLYKFDFNFFIAECIVERETPTTYKYHYRNNNLLNTVKKDRVDVVVKGTLFKLTATSKAKLLELAVESLDAKIDDAMMEAGRLETLRKRLQSRM